ncbi:MAG: anhydro-N-acetylmuramic acid kinase [Hyphomonadaceae bacterium]|nr:anhydro-N-acetylmuramic acid kinase [Hyphomonadaceae bacterium]
MSKAPGDAIWALGCMTGTALDGAIDLALVRTDGAAILELGPWGLVPYGEDLRAFMAEAVTAARAWDFKGPEPAILPEAERRFTLAHAEAIRWFLADVGVAVGDVALVGVHGLTVLHRPSRDGAPGRTRQLADGPLLARELDVAVAFDFRSADVAAGGEGAPLAPVYHAALLAFSGQAAPAAALNLGGVANITWWGGDGAPLIAFDTGPANGPINEWMERCGRGAYDVDGALAASGAVDEERLARLLRHAYFARPYPKSLDRYDFSAAIADGLSPADGAATLTAFSAAAVGLGLDRLPQRPARLIVCGGGRKNPTLMAELAKRTGVAAVDADAVGWRGDAVEAECFAFLAARTRAGLPLSFPGTTAVPAPLTGGRLAPRPA